MVTIEDYIEEIVRVIDAFQGGVDAPRNITDFITLSQRLRLLFCHLHSVQGPENAAVSWEKLLVEAIDECLSCFIHFESDIFSDVFATNDFNSPAFRVLEELLMTAAKEAKLFFRDKLLEDQMHQSIIQVFRFVPTALPFFLEPEHAACNNAIDLDSFNEPGYEGNIELGGSSGNTSSSTVSDQVCALSTTSVLREVRSPSMDETPSAAVLASPPRRLAKLMDTNDIISLGLGLSRGRREMAQDIEDNETVAFSEEKAVRTEADSSEGSRDTLGQSSSLRGRTKTRVRAKRIPAPRKSTNRRQRTASTRSNPNKENINRDV